MATVMAAKDTISASLAECFVTIEGNRYNFMQAISLEANFEKNKTEVPILAGRERVLPPSITTLPFFGR